jgi:rhodanese-related sulfurtransferase
MFEQIRTLIRTAAFQTAAIIVGGTILGTVVNGAAPWSIALIGEQRVLAQADDSALTALRRHETSGDTSGINEPLSVTLSQARQLWTSGASIFVDARPPYEYSDGFIPGAVNIPYEEIEYYRSEIAALPKDSVIVIYCAGESCDLSVHLGDALAEDGFTRVRVFFGGWVEWVKAEYDVDEGGN